MNIPEDTLRNLVITFFFAIYWGAMISGMPKFSVFQIWTFKRPGHRWRLVLRLLFGVLVLNIYPIVLFYAIYNGPFVPTHAPEAILCAGIAALSVFSAVFLLPGLLQMGFGKILYPSYSIDPDYSWYTEAAKENIGRRDSWFVMILTAIAYVIIPFFIAWLIAR